MWLHTASDFLMGMGAWSSGAGRVHQRWSWHKDIHCLGTRLVCGIHLETILGGVASQTVSTFGLQSFHTKYWQQKALVFHSVVCKAGVLVKNVVPSSHLRSTESFYMGASAGGCVQKCWIFNRFWWFWWTVWFENHCLRRSRHLGANVCS